MEENKSYVNGNAIHEGTSGNTGPEHFEGMGNAWSALLSDIDVLLENLQKSIQQGKIIFRNKKFAIILDSETDNTGIYHIIGMGEKQSEHISSAPFLKGVHNEVTIKETYIWQNKAEAEITAVTADGRTLSFYNPCYVADRNKCKPDKKQIVSLAAVAYHLEKLQEQEFNLDKGAFFDLQLQEFLQANPGKTEADFKPPVVEISADYFRMFQESDNTSEYQVSGKIEDVTWTTLLGDSLAVLKVNLSTPEEKEKLYINVYASKEALQDYQPQKGDGIIAVIWLCGQLN